jgi:hypothetical protein
MIAISPPDYSDVKDAESRKIIEVLHSRLFHAVKAFMELHTVYKDMILCRTMASQFPWRGKAISRSEHLHLDELGAIAFSDISNIVNWDDKFLDLQPGDVAMIDGEEIEAGKGGITRIVRSKVRMLPSATIDTSISRAIASVSQTAKGSLKVKLHDKIAALDKLARALGMYQPIEDAGNNTRSMVAVTIYEGRPASRPPRGEPASGVVGGDRDESD